MNGRGRAVSMRIMSGRNQLNCLMANTVCGATTSICPIQSKSWAVTKTRQAGLSWARSWSKRRSRRYWTTSQPFGRSLPRPVVRRQKMGARRGAVVTRSRQQEVTTVQVTPVLGLGMVAWVNHGMFKVVTNSQCAHSQAGAPRSIIIGGGIMRPRLGQGTVSPDMHGQGGVRWRTPAR